MINNESCWAINTLINVCKYYLWKGVRDTSLVCTLICQAINTWTDSARVAWSPFLASGTSLHFKCQPFCLLNVSVPKWHRQYCSITTPTFHIPCLSTWWINFYIISLSYKKQRVIGMIWFIQNVLVIGVEAYSLCLWLMWGEQAGNRTVTIKLWRELWDVSAVNIVQLLAKH